jgi:hypothetical protein
MTMTFKKFIQMHEHAMYQRNTYKFPYIYDQDDLKFLQQFPPAYWVEALKWRFEEGLLQIAEKWQSEIEPQIPDRRNVSQAELAELYKHFNFPDRQDVKLQIWADATKKKQILTFKDIKTGLKKLWWDLQVEIPEGVYDYDVTEPARARDPETGEKLEERDPPHRFNITLLTKINQTARRNLNVWAKCMEIGILGKAPEKAVGPDGKEHPTQLGEVMFGRRGGRAGKSNKYQVPTIRVKLPAYEEETLEGRSKAGKKTIPAQEYNIPVINNGVIIAKTNPETGMLESPFKVHNRNIILKALGLESTPRNMLIRLPLLDPTARPPRTKESLKQLIRQYKKELGLGEEYIKLIDRKIIDSADQKLGDVELSVQHLIIATNPKYSTDNWHAKLVARTDSRESFSESLENLLSNFYLLAPENQKTLRESHITSKELVQKFGTQFDPAAMDMWVAGGWNPQKNETAREKQERIQKTFGDEGGYKQAYQHYMQLAANVVRNQLNKSTNPVEQGLLNINGEDWASYASLELINMGDDPQVGWSTNTEENSKRDGKRKSFIAGRISRYMRIAKNQPNILHDTEDEGEEGEMKRRELVQGQQGLSSYGSTVGRHKFRKAVPGMGIAASIQQSTQEVTNRIKVSEKMEELNEIYNSLIQQYQRTQQYKQDPKQSLIDAQEYAIKRLQEEAKKYNIDLDISPDEFIRIFRTLKSQEGSPIAISLEDDYQPDKPAETEEEQEGQEDAIVNLQMLAQDGEISLTGNDEDLVNLKTIKPKNSAIILKHLKNYFASRSVPKDVFDSLWPKVLQHVPSETKPPLKKTTATSPSLTPNEQTLYDNIKKLYDMLTSGQEDRLYKNIQDKSDVIKRVCDRLSSKVPDIKQMGDNLLNFLQKKQTLGPEAPIEAPVKSPVAVVSPSLEALYRGMKTIYQYIVDGQGDAIIPKLQNDKVQRGLKYTKDQMQETHPDVVQMYDVIYRFMKSKSIVEMSLPIGYPNRPNGRYSKRIKNMIRKSGAQAWGTAGIDENLNKKWLSLKEYLEISELEKRKSILKQKIEAKIYDHKRS